MDSLTFSLVLGEKQKQSGWFNVCPKTHQKQELSGFEVMCILLLWWRGEVQSRTCLRFERMQRVNGE